MNSNIKDQYHWEIGICFPSNKSQFQLRTRKFSDQKTALNGCFYTEILNQYIYT